MNPFIEIKNVSKSYEKTEAVKHVSLPLFRGKIYGLLGPNGAGKTSLIRMLTGITNPDKGEILFDNEPFNLYKHIQNIGYMPEERGLYKKMKVGEQALYLAQLKGMKKSDAYLKLKNWFERLNMLDWWNKEVKDLSKGMAQKLQFISTIIHEPQLLILDEPFSGLDPINADEIKNIIFELNNQHTCIIFSTHRMEQVEEICNQIILFNKGEIVLEGEMNQLKKQFQTHLFSIKTQPTLPAENCQDFSFVKNGQKETSIIKINSNVSANQLLTNLINQQFSIEHFSMLEPSLNDIFVQVIKKIDHQNT